MSGKKENEMEGLLAPISAGELIDKITILEIKRDLIGDAEKRKNVENELALLLKTRSEKLPDSLELDKLTSMLKEINRRLWDIEDDLRECERQKKFDANFVELARSVYIENDQRAAIKKEINVLLGSAIVEEKSYASY